MSCDRCGQDARMYIRFHELELCNCCYRNNINFEEENKMDNLKVYTGKETIEALLEGKVLQSLSGYQYKMSDDDILSSDKPGKWTGTLLSAKSIMNLKFTEVVTPQVGDWVRVTAANKSYVGELLEVDGEWLRANWDGRPDAHGVRLVFSSDTWEILTPEQISEYKREQAFVKVGRKLNEFRSGDIVFIESIMETAVVVSNVNTDEVKVHVLNKTNGFKAKPHQLRPISFVEDQVSLD